MPALQEGVLGIALFSEVGAPDTLVAYAEWSCSRDSGSEGEMLHEL